MDINLPDIPVGWAYVVDDNGNYVLDNLGRYVIAPTGITSFSYEAVLPLDGCYGGSTLIRQFPLPTTRQIQAGMNIVVLLAINEILESDQLCSIAFFKPSGGAFKIPAAVGTTQMATAIGVMVSQGYVGGDLYATDLNESGIWSACLAIGSSRGQPANFVVH